MLGYKDRNDLSTHSILSVHQSLENWWLCHVCTFIKVYAFIQPIMMKIKLSLDLYLHACPLINDMTADHYQKYRISFWPCFLGLIHGFVNCMVDCVSSCCVLIFNVQPDVFRFCGWKTLEIDLKISSSWVWDDDLEGGCPTSAI